LVTALRFAIEIRYTTGKVRPALSWDIAGVIRENGGIRLLVADPYF